MEPVPGDKTRIHHCTECGATLAHDQRYCVECGARRGPLPQRISQLIGGIFERGQRAAVPGALESGPPDRERGSFDAWLAAPRAAAVAVMGMLAFGVVVGSLVGGSYASSFAPIIVARSPSGSHSISTPVSGGFGGGGGSVSGGSGGSGGTITITTTTPSPPAGTDTGVGATSPTSTSSTTTNSTPPSNGLPPIKHVFMIVLSGAGFSQTFGHPASDPYLAKTLVKQGELIDYQYAVAGGPLANEIALISGQGPTPQTVDNCPTPKKIVPGTADLTNGEVLGNGCVYPKTTQTLADQLTAAHLTWKAYVQTVGSKKRARAELCRPTLGSAAAQPTVTHPYAAWRNPFLYFRSLSGKRACPKNNVLLGQLGRDLKSASTTPSFSYIIPDVCHDGSDEPCPGAQPGMGRAETFLKSVVPKIKHSPAYKAGGMIVITFDGAPQSGQYADPSSCCNDPTYPNLSSSAGTTTAPADTTGATGTTVTTTTPTDTTGTTGTTTTPTDTTGTTGTTTTPTDTTGTTGTTTTPTATTTTPTGTTGPSTLVGGGATSPTGGGGRVGLLILSRYVKPGFPDATDYFNHFSLLGSIEDLFGLKRLGYADDKQLPVFGAAVYDNYRAG